jgi:hypothetical protein
MSRGSGHSSKGGRAASLADFAMAQQASVGRDFEPCDATASMFLYAQGSSIVCAHHDTLSIERRFSRHTEHVQLLAVDNISERGAGRLVISYDVGQTAIVWDLMTGDEVARFASYNNLTVAAWMKNGNVAFGTSMVFLNGLGILHKAVVGFNRIRAVPPRLSPQPQTEMLT